MLSPSVRGVLFALASALAFSSLVIWGKLAAQLELPAYTALCWRFALVALVLFGSGAARGAFTGGDRARMIAGGALYMSATVCIFLAIERISAGTTSLLLYLAPAFVVLFQWLLGRRPRAVQLGAVALSLVGLLLVVGLPGAGDRDPLGLAFGVLTGAVYAAYLVFSERYLKYPPLASTAHLALVAAVGFTVLAAATGTLGVPHGAAQWGVVIALAVLPTLLAVPALYAALRLVGAARTSLVATTEPLWTVLLAFLVLGEPLGPRTFLGGGLILGGALLAQLPTRSERAAARPEGDRAAPAGDDQ